MNQNVKSVRYVPEHAMGAAKFRSRKRTTAAYIPNSTQRKRAAEAVSQV
jgi:hypothetical protein